jgi:hypothetical protein
MRDTVSKIFKNSGNGKLCDWKIPLPSRKKTVDDLYLFKHTIA